MAFIGIDFGTSNSVVANFRFGQAEVLPNKEGQKYTPSIVTMRRDGSLAFGMEAKETFDESRSIRSIKRILGTSERVPLVGQSLRAEQIAVMLFSLLKKDAETALGEAFTKVVVTIPANSRGLARHATKVCAGAAGMQVLTLINEPTAAAISYGINARDEQTVLVYDFGGGTLDVTILRIHNGIFEEISSKGIGKLGGDDIDFAIGEIIAKRFEEKTGYDILNSPYRTPFLLAVEKAKIELSAAEKTVVRAPQLVPDRHLSLEEELDRATLEKAILPLIQKSGEAIDEALSLRHMTPRDIDRVLLVGGTSKIPLVGRFVTERLGGKQPEPFDKVDPMTCVAEGAAIVSAILQNAPGLDRFAYSVKLEHSLCANPINERNEVYLDPIIKRGSDIPCKFTKTYYPVADPCERVMISVFEGDTYLDPGSSENVMLAEIPWEFKPSRPQRDGALEVTYEYGDDGILTVEISDAFANQRKRYAIQQASEDQLSVSQVQKMKRINEELVNRGEQLENTLEYREALEVLKKTEQDVLPKLDNPDDRRDLEELCKQVRQAMTAADKTAMVAATQAVSDRLLNYAYLL
ncbi:MAG TPA: Hsp70 family protein [Gemmataceae bacterium]|jgi:molecular chaperone DnaK|nr:Hsp70 family protein [Gemmataceae bacterium]